MIGADLWLAGRCWAGVVARRWQATVAASLAAVKTDAERRTGRPATHRSGNA